MRIASLWKRSWTLPALVLALALAASGCSRGKTDAELAGEVQNQLNAAVPNQPITVSAHEGVVTLSGTVNSESDRRAAAQEATKVEGVKVVVNDLQVMPAAASIPEAPVYSSPQSRPAVNRASPYRPRARSAETASSQPSYSSASTAASPVPVHATIERATIPEGTVLSVRMIDGIDTAKNRLGDTFRATLEAPLMVGDRVVAPIGTEVEGRVAELKSAGHFSGRSELALELVRLDMNGKSYPLETSAWTGQGNSRGKRTAATIGGGAALGAIIGAIAGGGKGAAIGTVAGAGAGTGVQAVTKGKQVKVNPEAVLEFRLTSQVTVVPSRVREPERPRLEREPPQGRVVRKKQFGRVVRRRPAARRRPPLSTRLSS